MFKGAGFLILDSLFPAGRWHGLQSVGFRIHLGLCGACGWNETPQSALHAIQGEKSVPLKSREECGTRDFIPEFHQTPQAVLRSTQDKKPTLPMPGPPAKLLRSRGSYRFKMNPSREMNWG